MEFDRNRRGSGDMNITPLIDLVFLLLIFFLLTSSFIMDKGIKIDLPRAASSETTQDDRVTVSIDAQGRVFLGRRRVETESLLAELEKAYLEKDTKTVYLKADTQSRVNALVAVMDIIKQSGSEKMTLVTQVKNKEVKRKQP